MPVLGESVTEGTITRWLKDVGDIVEADQPLLEISTDKVDTEIPAPAAGVLLEILVGEEEIAEVGAQLSLIGAPARTTSATTPSTALPPSRTEETASTCAPISPPAAAAAPAARVSSPHDRTANATELTPALAPAARCR
ncbi:biotin/lipoyl-containing protein [Actinomadura sp. OS1-43]|uniref:biotin/lipoyl-containing protein n=1 Tax=Actinomadura sp. OS1-43 TaxID=604315 RepID=UPI00255AD717|nr:biotin/lipoyl-containing protein [Actinomadura sp. OS1-43]MDL4818601.1 biotin/lipoyl-containing protein [Actinomadura sp. OS1-43]